MQPISYKPFPQVKQGHKREINQQQPTFSGNKNNSTPVKEGAKTVSGTVRTLSALALIAMLATKGGISGARYLNNNRCNDLMTTEQVTDTPNQPTNPLTGIRDYSQTKLEQAACLANQQKDRALLFGVEKATDPITENWDETAMIFGASQLLLSFLKSTDEKEQRRTHHRHH